MLWNFPGNSVILKHIDNPDPELRFPYKNYTHYGMSWQEIERQIKNSPAEIYFISSLFTTYYMETERVIEIIRKHAKVSLHLAAGGYHASLYPEYYLNDTGVDFVICGGRLRRLNFSRAIGNGIDLQSITRTCLPGQGSIKKIQIIKAGCFAPALSCTGASSGKGF